PSVASLAAVVGAGLRAYTLFAPVRFVVVGETPTWALGTRLSGTAPVAAPWIVKVTNHRAPAPVLVSGVLMVLTRCRPSAACLWLSGDGLFKSVPVKAFQPAVPSTLPAMLTETNVSLPGS